MSDLDTFLAQSSEPDIPAERDITPEPAEPEYTEPEAQPAPEAAAPREDDEQPPEGLDKRGEGIWREERRKRKDLQQQVDQMNNRWMEMVTRMQTAQPPAAQPQAAAPQPQGAQPEIEVPDFDDDPIGHLRAKNELLERQLQDVNMERVMRHQANQQVQQFQQLQSGVDQMETAFARETPDYHDAVGFLYEHVGKMAAAMGQNPQQAMSQTAMNLSVSALQQGRNPAQAAYEAARQLGWGNQQSDHGQPTPPPSRPRTPTSLSTVAGKRADGGGTPSWDVIAKMDTAEFDKLWKDMEKNARH